MRRNEEGVHGIREQGSKEVSEIVQDGSCNEVGQERKKKMTVKELKEFIEEIPDDTLVHVIFRGIIDQQPSLNVDEKVLYVEGM